MDILRILTPEETLYCLLVAIAALLIVLTIAARVEDWHYQRKARERRGREYG